jgi:hypothetical protein
VDLRLRQRSEHLRERDGIPHRVRHDTFDSSAPVVSEAFTKTFAAPKRVNLDLLSSQDELHAFTGLRPENGVAPALEGEEAVAGDGALGALDDQVRLGRQRQERRAVERRAVALGALEHRLAMGAMHPLAGYFLVPAQPRALGFVVVSEGVRSEQPLAHIAHIGFYLALGLRPVGTAQTYPESVVVCGGQGLGMEDSPLLQTLLTPDVLL